MKISKFLSEHKVFSFLGLTFLISWGITLLVALQTGIPGSADDVDRLFSVALMGLLIGPPISGLLLTGLLYGKEGLKSFSSSLLKGKLSLGWYAFVLFLTPVVTFTILFILSRFSPSYLPKIFGFDEKLSVIFSGIAIGLMGGLFEETGWTGFLLPELRKRHGVFLSGLIIGFIWGLWHCLVTLWASGDWDGAFVPILFLPPFVFYMLVLPVFRILMVWVHEKTQSLLMIVLMHAGLTASTLFIFQPAVAEKKLVLYYLILAAVLGLIVGCLALSGRKNGLKILHGSDQE